MQPDITIAGAQDLVLKPSYELARAQFMGWTFGKPIITQDPVGFRLRISFQQEWFSYIATRLEDFRHVDVAQYLTAHGSFSREHLLDDGYTLEQISEIERKGEEFDRVTREHWEREIHRAGGFDAFRMRDLNAR